MPTRIHIFGASGAGTSTLGRELARRFELSFFDIDDFFWQPTDPPYTKPHDAPVRVKLLAEALAAAPGWVISGSLCGWGDSFRQQFDLAIFLLTPTEIRLARLRDRELARFGNHLGPGGDMHEENKAFMAWASQYDHASLDMRSRQLHENWLKTLTCPVIRLDGSRPLSELSEQVRATQFLENPDSGLV